MYMIKDVKEQNMFAKYKIFVNCNLKRHIHFQKLVCTKQGIFKWLWMGKNKYSFQM